MVSVFHECWRNSIIQKRHHFFSVVGLGSLIQVRHESDGVRLLLDLLKQTLPTDKEIKPSQMGTGRGKKKKKT